jgi:hypothetical protein
MGEPFPDGKSPQRGPSQPAPPAPGPGADPAEELLCRALLDHDDGAAVAMRVDGLAVCGELTIIFHGRRDLSTIQTYIALGGRHAGEAVDANELLRVPCYLDLADAETRDDAEQLYREQAALLRESLRAADTVLAIWSNSLAELTSSRVRVEHASADGDLPAPLLMPIALRAAERGVTVAPVCSARTLSEGRPPLGIACVQQEVSHVYPLPDDPERCLEDFFERAADHAHVLAGRLAHQEASVERFLEISGC